MVNKRVFGFFLLIVGLVMILGTSPRITGNVVLDEVPGLGVVRVLGILFFVSGIMLMTVGTGTRERRREYSLDELLDIDLPSEERPIIVFDMGGFIGNKRELDKIMGEHRLENYGMDNIIVPSEVNDEIASKSNRNFRKISRMTDNPDNSPDVSQLYTEVAEYILQHSGKLRMKNEIYPRIMDWVEKSKGRAILDLRGKYPDKTDKGFAKTLRREYFSLFGDLSSEEIKELVSNFNGVDVPDKDYLDKLRRIIKTSREFEAFSKIYGDKNGDYDPNMAEMREYLEKEVDADAQDINVLGTVLHEIRNAPQNKKIIVYARDMDIKESVENLRKDVPYLQDAIEKDIKEGRIKENQATVLERLSDRLKRLEYRRAPR